MKIHELPGDPGRRQKRKRLGRGEGSGHGKTSGKGHKGHQARSGGTKKPSYFEGGQMPLPRRIPKFGFKNPFRVEYEVVSVSSLEKSFEAGSVVDVEALKALLFRMSALLEAVPEIDDVDLNPVFVRSRGVAAVDARIKVARHRRLR